MPLAMSDYHLKPLTSLSSLATQVQEHREQRRKVLEAAAKVRQENYKRFREKMKQSHFSEFDAV